ncbi:MAG: MgtC/SapB family protein [Flavobacteriales bacterium]|nr:MgtC/SapB family protein [Flavobacteriales bacterium]
MEIELGEFLFKVSAAAVAGLTMGLERQFKKKHAGLKTNALVAIGAAVFVIICLPFMDENSTDMTRIVGQIVVGVGFLGAGVILQPEGKEKEVKGLATAATIWCSAAAGCLAGFGIYIPLLVLAGVVVIVNSLFGFLNQIVKEKVDESERE